MRVLMCGSRDWIDPEPIRKAFERHQVTVCIHGGARGADTLAGREAALRGIPVAAFRAEWERYGRGAGPIRNQRMVDEGAPELVIAFHSDIEESRGTADMVRRAIQAGIPTEVIQ